MTGPPVAVRLGSIRRKAADKAVYLLSALAATAALLCGALAAPAGAEAAVKRVSVIDNSFRPAAVAVKRGDTVRWVFARANSNPHNVTARQTPRGISKRAFTSAPAISGGRVFSRTFRRVGLYRFHCTLHFGMEMQVRVTRPARR